MALPLFKLKINNLKLWLKFQRNFYKTKKSTALAINVRSEPIEHRTKSSYDRAMDNNIFLIKVIMRQLM